MFTTSKNDARIKARDIPLDTMDIMLSLVDILWRTGILMAKAQEMHQMSLLPQFLKLPIQGMELYTLGASDRNNERR